MTFIHPALLAGLALAILPVILHLILRQQPKRLPFPAFRFIARKATSNRRRLKLRHLLLLLLRIAMVALMCLALARPRIFSERLNLMGEQPVAAVLIVDTSVSMGYTVAGKSRLDEAKSRALELVAGFPPGSRVAVLDPAEFGGDWQPGVSAAGDRIASRELQPAAGSLADPIATAYRLFEELARETPEGDEPAPRFLYLFTDRTPACWDATRTNDLMAARDRVTGPKINQLVVDVGIDKPADVAVTEIRLSPQIIPANKPVLLPATIRSTGPAVETQVQCRIVGLPELDSKPISLADGQAKEIVFRRSGLPPGFHQAEISLATSDALVADNIRYVTFEVRVAKPVLVICNQASDTKALDLALKANYPCEIKSTNDPDLRTITPIELAKYRAVVLLSVAAPGPLWAVLEAYVVQGGGLAIFPGGDELDRNDYNRGDGPAAKLLPGTLKQLLDAGDDGAVWTEYQYQHPLMAPFREYAQQPETGFAERPPRTYRYWEVEPRPMASALVRYTGDPHRPAVLETVFDRAKARGKVLMFTTPFDDRRDARDRPWNDYLQTWFYLALTNKSLQYLAGESDDAEFNYIAGQAVGVALPASVRAPALNLAGPGLTGTDSLVSRPEKTNDIRLTQPRQAGNYSLTTPDRSWQTSFSVNTPPGEYLLLPRVPVDTIAQLCGPDSIISPEGKAGLQEKLALHFRQPLELFPWLMLLLLGLFVFENLLANRFYRNDRSTTGANPSDTMSP